MKHISIVVTLAALTGCAQSKPPPPVVAPDTRQATGPICIFENQTYGLGSIVNNRVCDWADINGTDYDKAGNVVHNEAPRWQEVKMWDMLHPRPQSTP